MSNIYFTGAGGTGKTTLRDLLAPKLGLKTVESVSRSSPFMPGTAEHQDYVSGRIYDDAVEKDGYLLDRTPFDVVAYDYAYDVGNKARDRWLANFFVTKKRPLVFYFPIYWQAEEDGFRPTDQKLLDAVDETIKIQLDFFRLDYYTVPNETPERRLELALEFLEKRKQNARILI